jgi:Tol biopolymer transport system component
MYGQVSPSDLSYPNNHLDWKTVESDHFLIHFQVGNQESALAISAIAEEIYGPVTSLYDYAPSEKTSIVLRDREDISNGAAYYFDNKIDIWLPSLDTPFRGTHSWYSNVIMHEFTHIIQLGASMNRNRKIPAIYLQWLTYEDIRRPDVLYGFPKGIVTLPLSTVRIPAWFAEGTAQYQREHIYHDFWDTHRDMLLRTRILSGTQLGYTEMGTFSSKTSLERELVYNQGFSFTNYLADQFGEAVIADITHQSAMMNNGNFANAIESVTNISADSLYSDWLESKRKQYNLQTSAFTETNSSPIEEKGSYNLYPFINRNGDRIAYISDQYDGSGITKLVIKDLISEAEETLTLGRSNFSSSSGRAGHSISHPYSAIELHRVRNRFSMSDDGQQAIYSHRNLNASGELYEDLFIAELGSESIRQITNNARISDPVWNFDHSPIVAVQQQDGRQNVVFVDDESGHIEQVTEFPLGTTVYSPVWTSDKSEIVFSAATRGNRDLYALDAESRSLRPILVHRDIDIRDPFIDKNNGDIYFSSDKTGIFNIYRTDKNFTGIEQITNVSGGAFMPFVHDESLYYSEFQHDGYKIRKLMLVNRDGSKFPAAEFTEHNHSEFSLDSRLLSDNHPFLNIEQEDSTNQLSYTFAYSDEPGNYSRSVTDYSETTTRLNVLPLVRFDNYSKLNGSNSRLMRNLEVANLGENLWRDVKAGAYLSARDVTGSLSLFGGLMVGPGSLTAESIGDFFSPSRLSSLDRDLFFIIDYAGIPFIEKRWSPTISLEFYNTVRNVRNGLEIEEFPCTSCLPEQRQINIRYSIWEANLFLRSKINRLNLLEFGASYSPYSVITDGFFSNEFRQQIPGSTSEYFRGFSYTAAHIMEFTIPEPDADIAPRGFKNEIRYRYEPSRLLDNFELDDGVLSPVYLRDNNHSVELKNRVGFKLSNKVTGALKTRFFSYLNSPDDFFYLDYAGGLSGMRSYPYFALGGQRTLFSRASIMLPLFSDINKQFRAYTIDKIFAHIYYETGNGWGGPLNAGNPLKHGIGTELRLSLNSAYVFPLKFFINSSYGFNQFSVTLPSSFISADGNNTVNYGKELLFYFGLTFDFDLL